jgi:hypothetical protein
MRALVISDTHFVSSRPTVPPGPGYFREFLERRLPGVQIEIAYPTYRFGVLCTHGHYLDPHARLSGSRGDRLLTRTLWAIAAGGPEEPNRIEDYESVTTLLTEWLYIAAQMPHGTHAQQNVFRAAQRAGRFAQALGAPVRGAERLAAKLRDRGQGETNGAGPLPSEAHFDAVVRGEAKRQAREQPLSGPAASRPIYPEPTVVSRSDPPETARTATGTPAPGSTSRTSAPARPTPATSATPGPAPRCWSTKPSRSRGCWRCSPTSTRLTAAPACQRLDSCRDRGLASSLRRPDPHPRPRRDRLHDLPRRQGRGERRRAGRVAGPSLPPLALQEKPPLAKESG